jgi:uncharacterized membrane protein
MTFMATSLQLILCMFDGADKAESVKQAIRALDKQLDTIKLGNIAVVRKNEQGEIEFNETADRRERISDVTGSVVNGVTWLVYNFAGMLGPVAGVTAGGHAKYAVERFMSDSGFPDIALRQVGERLDAGHSALITMVQPDERPIVVAELQKLGGHVLEHELPADVIEALSGAAPASPAATATSAEPPPQP